MSFVCSAGLKQPSQQPSVLEDPNLEIYTWKIGKNPYPGLVSNRNVALSENFNSLELDIQPDAIVCGDEHAVFVAEGKLYAMGENTDGRLGISKRNVRTCSSPMLVRALSNFRVVKVSCGSRHTAALIDSGEVFTWGYGGDGQLGLRNDLTQYSPQYVYLERNEFFTRNEEPVPAVDVSCGASHTGIISKSGDIYMFGSGDSGQLGNGKFKNEHLPFKIRLQNEKAEKIACGSSHTLVLTAKGCIYGFGANAQGQLGTGNRRVYEVPHKVAGLEKVKIVKIDADQHSAALSVLGHLYVWGPCVLGECLTPQRVCKNIENPITDVQISGAFTSIVDLQGNFWVLGAQRRGELGVESLEARTLASQISALKDKKIRTMSCARDLLIMSIDKSRAGNTSQVRGGSLSPSFRDLNSSGFKKGFLDTVESIAGRKIQQPTQTGSPLLSRIFNKQKYNMFERSFDGENQDEKGINFTKAENILLGVYDGTDRGVLPERETPVGATFKEEDIEKDKQIQEMEEEDKKTNLMKDGESIDYKEIKTMKELVDTMNYKDEVENVETNEEMQILREPSQKELKVQPQVKDKNTLSKPHFSLTDVEVESFDIEEQGSFANINGTFFRRGTGDESPMKMNESRVSDIMLDLKVMRMKNNMIENQIEEKAKQLALLESRMDFSHSGREISDDRSKEESEEVVVDSEPIVRTFSALDFPLRTLATQEANSQPDIEVAPEDIAPLKKIDESIVLVDSLTKENKSLKGLVNYLLQAKNTRSNSAAVVQNQQYIQNLSNYSDLENASPPSSPGKQKLVRSLIYDMEALSPTDPHQPRPLNKTLTDLEVFPAVIKPIQRKLFTRSLTTPEIHETLTTEPQEEKPIVKRTETTPVGPLTVQTKFESKDKQAFDIKELSTTNTISQVSPIKESISKTRIPISKQPSNPKDQQPLSSSSQMEEASSGQINQFKRFSKFDDCSPIQTIDSSFRLKPEKSESELLTPATIRNAEPALSYQEPIILQPVIELEATGTPELGYAVADNVNSESDSYIEDSQNNIHIKDYKNPVTSYQNKNSASLENFNKNVTVHRGPRVVESFVIAPPQGAKLRSTSKSPTKATRAKQIATAESKPRVINKASRSFSMSFGSDADFNKSIKGTKLHGSSMHTDGDVTLAISPINPCSVAQTPPELSPQNRMNGTGGINFTEAEMLNQKRSDSPTKKKKMSKKTAGSISISLASREELPSELKAEKRSKSPSKISKIEKTPTKGGKVNSKVNKSVVMLKSSVPKEEKRVTGSGKKSMLVTFTANVRDKTPEQAEKSVEKKKKTKKIKRSKTDMTQEDDEPIESTKFLQTPSFITTSVKSQEIPSVLVKSDTLESLPSKIERRPSDSPNYRESKPFVYIKSASLIREPNNSNQVSKYEEEKESSIFDIIDSSFSKKMDSPAVEKPFSSLASPINEKKQVSYSQAEALVRLLGVNKAKKVARNKFKNKGTKQSNITEFYDQLSEVIKANR